MLIQRCGLVATAGQKETSMIPALVKRNQAAPSMRLMLPPRTIFNSFFVQPV
jgi:hypothetical protein